MEQRGFKFDVKSIDEQGVFEGYAAIFSNVDLGGDVIEPGAFKKTLKENKKMPILWQHNPKEPIGVTLEAQEDEKGLKVKGQLNLETTRGREAYALLKQGALKGLSIGYDAIKEIWDGAIRRLKEIYLWEWSLVTFPMNPKSIVLDVKENDFMNFDMMLYSIIGMSNEIKAGRVNYNVNRVLVDQTIKTLQEFTETKDDDDQEPETNEPDSLLDETIKSIKDFLREVK